MASPVPLCLIQVISIQFVYLAPIALKLPFAKLLNTEKVLITRECKKEALLQHEESRILYGKEC